MIQLLKTGRNEAWLRLDTNGALQLLSSLSSLRAGSEPAEGPIATVDGTLLGRRQSDPRDYLLRLAKQHTDSSDASLSLDDGAAVLRLVDTEQEIDYAISRLEDALARGTFAPAEFLMIVIPKSTHLVQVYGELVRDVGDSRIG